MDILNKEWAFAIMVNGELNYYNKFNVKQIEKIEKFIKENIENK